MNRRLLIVVLLGFFVSASFHFYFPLLTLYLIDFGYAPWSAPLVISLVLLSTALLLPWTGSLLDQGKIAPLFICAGLAILFGLSPFLVNHALPPAVFLAACVSFVVGTAFIYNAARRLTEGLASRANLSKAASLSFMVENSGMGTSAVIAYFFIEKHRTLLIFIDAATTTAFLILLYVIYRAKPAELRESILDRLTFTETIKEGARFLKRGSAVPVGSLFLMVSLYALFTGLQVLYLGHVDEPKKWTALMKGTNTIVVAVASLGLARGVVALGQKTQFYLAGILISLGYFIAPVVLTKIGVVFSTILWSLGEALFYPVFASFVIASFPSNRPGLAVGVKDLMIRFGLVVSPLVASAISTADSWAYSLVYGTMPLIGLFWYYWQSQKRDAMAVLLSASQMKARSLQADS